MLKPKQLGHLVLRVRDLDACEKFYSEILGLHVTNKRSGQMVFMSASETASHELALIASSPDAPVPDKGGVGLYHFAWEMRSFEDLQQMYLELKQKEVDIVGIGDHGISIGVYVLDPEGNEIEMFYELPQKDWPSDGAIFDGKFPRSLEKDVTGIPV